MQKHLLKSGITGILLCSLLAPGSVLAMRCGSVLINKGDTQQKVLEHCGEPAEKTSRYVQRPGVYRGRSSGLEVNGSENASRGQFIPYGETEVLLQEWTYNFGPNKLMRRVRFGNGIVEEVKTLDYGYDED